MLSKSLLAILFIMFSVSLLLLSAVTYVDLPPKVEKMGKLPSEVKESSGLAIAGDHAFWTHNDHGNKPRLYKIDEKGDLLETIKFNHITNLDWEDLTEDDKGYLYIGDFGNDGNERKDLVIYKVLKSDLRPDNASISTEAIFFSYLDQTDFPPSKSDRHFDVEAMFYKDKNLYLLTKDQSNPSINSSRLYQLPNKPGTYQAKYISEFTTKHKKNKGQITSADISPDGKILAVTSNENLWIFRDFKRKNFFDGTEEQIKLIKGRQIEAVVFEDDCTLFLTCERNTKGKASLYKVHLCDQ